MQQILAYVPTCLPACTPVCLSSSFSVSVSLLRDCLYAFSLLSLLVTTLVNTGCGSGFHLHRQLKLGRVTQFMLWLQNEAYGRTKIRNIADYHAKNPESGYCSVFVGDNGQGDAMAAREMLKQGSKMAATFIHDVTDDPSIKLSQAEMDRLVYFRTYPMAALKAFQLGMMTLTGAQTVVKSAMGSAEYKSCNACTDPCGICVPASSSHFDSHTPGGCAELLMSTEAIACCKLSMPCCNAAKKFSCVKVF